ncbi:MAG: hypothetical protein WBR24_16165 [Desulfobacterales bacterium]
MGGDDGVIPGITAGTSKRTEDEKDLLSNIIKVLNDTYAIDLSDEDKVDIERMKEKLDDHEELREVMSSNNTRDNMKYKFEQVVDELLLDFVNSKLELYKKLSEPRVNTMFKSRWFEGYQKQLQSEDRIGSAPV